MGFKKLGKLIFSAIILLLVVRSDARATEGGYYQESVIQASYILNFIEFVKWDKNYKNNQNICVIGDDSLGGSLSTLSAQSELKINIDKVSINSRLDLCSIVFIGESVSKDLERILYIIAGKPILTVSDIDNFVDSGGMIGFKKIDNSIKIEINKTIATHSGLVFNAKLLQVAIRLL